MNKSLLSKQDIAELGFDKLTTTRIWRAVRLELYNQGLTMYHQRCQMLPAQAVYEYLHISAPAGVRNRDDC